MNNFQTFYYSLYIICGEIVFLFLGYLCCFHIKICPSRNYCLESRETDIAYLKRRFWKIYFLFLYGMMAVTLLVGLLILLIRSVKG